MKNHIFLPAIVAISVSLVGCSAAQQSNANDMIANLNKSNLIALQTISNGCKIVQPTLAAASPANPNIATAAGVNAVICATAAVAADAASGVVAAQAASAPVVSK